MIAGPTRPPGPAPWTRSAFVQPASSSGCATTCRTPTTTTVAFSARKSATRGIATTTASLKPSRKTKPRISSRITVIRTFLPWNASGVYGFSIRCTDASAADRVIVTSHDVTTKPSTTSTKTLPRQNGQQPLEHGHRALPVRALDGHPPVHRQHAEQREGDDQQGRDGRQGAGGEGGDAGQVGQRREVVDAGQAHHLPPGLRGVRVLVGGQRAGRLHLVGHQPAVDALRGRAGRAAAGPLGRRRTAGGPGLAHGFASAVGQDRVGGR